jgi:hypothetical protein
MTRPRTTARGRNITLSRSDLATEGGTLDRRRGERTGTFDLDSVQSLDDRFAQFALSGAVVRDQSGSRACRSRDSRVILADQRDARMPSATAACRPCCTTYRVRVSTTFVRRLSLSPQESVEKLLPLLLQVLWFRRAFEQSVDRFFHFPFDLLLDIPRDTLQVQSI